ncbi:MAG: adenylosuccinate synthetase [Candidatus Altiarchaeota archaeon]
MLSVIVGGHFGDEGKGKIVSYLAVNDNPPVIARAGVGPNAGHTVYKNGEKFGLRMIPCGFVNEESKLLIGAGVLVDPDRLLKEIEMTGTAGRLFIDYRCIIIEEKHRLADVSDNSKKIGTTGSGCGPANADRVNRIAKQAKEFEELDDYLVDVPKLVNDALDKNDNVLLEASQGFGLSLYYGNYPYVTSKDTSASSACADVGVGPTRVDEVIVVFKAYMSRVGHDPFVHYLINEEIEGDDLWERILERAKAEGHKGENDNQIIAQHLKEVGTVTGRPRKIGKFDFELAKYSTRVNGATQIAVTCLDKLFPDSFGIRDYESLDKDAQTYIKLIESELHRKITLISTGPEPEDIIDLRK